MTGTDPQADGATTLLVEVEADGSGWRLASPAVGRLVGAPRDGARMGPGDRVGELEVLGRAWVLRLPDGAAGYWVCVAGNGAAVGYGDALGRLEDGAGAAAPARGAPAPAAPDALDGTPVRAPSSGRYYRRPAPEKPPFVNVGDLLESGQPVGLLEVMKTFTRVHYGGPGLPETARVVALVAEDGQEVAEGDALLLVAPRDAEDP